MNSSEPSGRKTGLASPSTDLVSRCAGPSAVSIRQMLLMYFFLPEDSVAIVAASPLASGDSSNDVALGKARNSPRSLKLDTSSHAGTYCAKLDYRHNTLG